MNNKKFFITFFMLFILFFTNNCTYASMADYTEEDAEKDTQQMIQEHKEHFDSNKSDNNYLKDLIITEGALSPNFDRQILQYSINIGTNIKEIEIKANPEDSKATVNGTGKVDISNASECKIEVVAESGTFRTYFIKIVKQNNNQKEENIIQEDNNDNSVLLENDTNNVTIVDNNEIVNNETSNDEQNNINKKYISIAIGIAVTVCIIFFIITLNNKKSKH